MRPFAEMDEMFDNFDHPLDEFEKGDWMPAVDIVERDKAYLVRAELPGVHRGDVHVVIESNVLTIRGEKRIEIEDREEQYHVISSREGIVQNENFKQLIHKSTKSTKSQKKNNGFFYKTLRRLE
ncbi:MAG: hypothetical protein DSZ20_02000, partial [Candidatus Thioglobus sp.]